MPQGACVKNLSMLAILLGAATLLGACGQPPAAPEEVRPVRTIVVTPGPVEAENVYAGEVRPRYESGLGFRVAGKLSARLINVGDTVKAGQVLARLDPKDLSLNEASSRANVAAQEAQFAVEKADLERYAKLLAQGFVSHAEYERQQTKFKAAEAQLASVRAQARVSANQTGYAELRADHDGTITAVEAETGQVVGAGQNVARLAWSGEMEIAVNVPENLIQDLRVGQPVQVSLWTADGKIYPARLRELSSNADAATRTYAVRIALDKTPGEMKLGMTANVRIPHDGLPDMVHLPLSAWVEHAGVQGVWVLDAKAGVVNFRALRPAGVTGNEILIAEGLQPGEVVVTAGAPLLTPGQKVKPLAAAVVAR